MRKKIKAIIQCNFKQIWPKVLSTIRRFRGDYGLILVLVFFIQFREVKWDVGISEKFVIIYENISLIV